MFVMIGMVVIRFWSIPSGPSRIAGVVVQGVLCLLIVIGVLVTWSVPSRIAGVVVGVVAVSEQGSRGRLLSWSLSEPPTVLLRLWL